MLLLGLRRPAQESEQACLLLFTALPDSPAAKAGIEGASADGVIRDVITQADGKPIHRMEELTSIFEDAGVGGQVNLTVDRDGRTRTVKLTVADISKYSRG